MCFFIACSGSDDSPNLEEETLISANIGGVAWEATTIAEANVLVITEEGQRFGFEAYDEEYKIKLAVYELDSVDGTLTEQTYSDDINTALLFYYGMGNDSFVSEHQPNQDFGLENNIVIDITSSTPEMISGTFSGTFYKKGDLTGMDTPEIVEITNGIFRNVPFELHEFSQP